MGMLGSKTVVYVTHQIEFLPAADLILVRQFHIYGHTIVGSEVTCRQV